MTVLLAAAACACSNAPVRIDSRPLGNQVSRSPERYIIVAVENEPAAFVAHAGATPRDYEVVSDYGPTAQARQTMHSVASEYGLKEVNAWPIEPLHVHCAVLEIPAGADRNSVLAALATARRGKRTRPVQTFATRTDSYNDPYFGLQRGFREMNVADAHPWSRGEGVKVAVIDTGVDVLHPDLKDRIAAAVNFVDADDAQFRRDRHGTEVAGVIAAVANNREGIVGIAPDAHLLVFKACWQTRSDADAARCNSFTLARALAAAFDAHAQIVNLSLAGPDDPLLGDLIREGQRRGVLFVGAAGEAAVNGLMHRPGIIQVASAESRAAGDGAAGDGELYAPGNEILTLLPGGHYDFASGESIATAQVSGVVALMLAKNAALSAATAYRLLHDTSSASGVDGGIGGVDACAAVVTLMGRGSCHASAADAHTRTDGQDRRVAAH